MHRAVDRAVEVGNHATAPTPNLITEQPEPSSGPPPNCAFGDDTPLGSSHGIGNGRHLDHERNTIHDRYEGGVKQATGGPALCECQEPFVSPSARAYDTGACAQGNPVEVECRRAVAERW